MYFYVEGWDDPHNPGLQYVSLVDDKYIIEYVRTEDGAFGFPVFVFLNPKGDEIRLARPQLKASYKLYNDPWAAQKAWAKKYGFKFVSSNE